MEETCWGTVASNTQSQDPSIFSHVSENSRSSPNLGFSGRGEEAKEDLLGFGTFLNPKNPKIGEMDFRVFRMFRMF